MLEIVSGAVLNRTGVMRRRLSRTKCGDVAAGQVAHNESRDERDSQRQHADVLAHCRRVRADALHKHCTMVWLTPLINRSAMC